VLFRSKQQIIEVLSPFVKGPEDIYGRDDLNNLLGLFPSVERQHFKLWLSSITVLEEVLHSRIINQTKITLHDIRDKARLYVSNDSFNKALDILKDLNYVVIAGIPGIGKTTLAKMLVLHYLRRGDYEFVDVSYDISEAYSIPDHERPRVYLYDDFLGRTSLAEKLRKNEDNRLVHFISAVRRTKSSKLILTTREYILRQAQGTYEVLNGPIFEKPQCIIDLSQYTRPIRAQILYNHLYFSGLSADYVEEIVKRAAYLKIIDHPNYNPRIVEYMTDPMWVGSHEPTQYPAAFLRNLGEPFLIWEQAFSNQITDTAREILLVLSTVPSEVFVEDLELATRRFVCQAGRGLSEKEFRRALAELQGNFVALKQDSGNDIVSFHNPSVQDFIDSYLERNPALYEALGKTACFFEQVQWLCEEGVKKGKTRQIEAIVLTQLKETLTATPCTLIYYSVEGRRSTSRGRTTLCLVERLGFLASLIKERRFAFLKETFRDALKKVAAQLLDIKPRNRDLLRLVEEVVALDYLAGSTNDFLVISKQSLYQNAHWISDVSSLVQFLKVCPEMRSSEDNERIVEHLDSIVNSLDYHDDPDLLRDELCSLEEIEGRTHLKLMRQIGTVRELLSRAEESYPPEEDYEDDRYAGSSGRGDSISNDALSDMFSTLLR